MCSDPDGSFASSFANADTVTEAATHFETGKRFHDGEGVDQNFEKARRHYLASAKLGNSNAMINLGYMFFVGEGVEKNYNTARGWYEAAFFEGSEAAGANLSMMDRLGLGLPADPVMFEIPSDIDDMGIAVTKLPAEMPSHLDQFISDLLDEEVIDNPLTASKIASATHISMREAEHANFGSSELATSELATRETGASEFVFSASPASLPQETGRTDQLSWSLEGLNFQDMRVGSFKPSEINFSKLSVNAIVAHLTDPAYAKVRLTAFSVFVACVIWMFILAIYRFVFNLSVRKYAREFISSRGEELVEIYQRYPREERRLHDRRANWANALSALVIRYEMSHDGTRPSALSPFKRKLVSLCQDPKDIGSLKRLAYIGVLQIDYYFRKNLKRAI